MIRPELPLELRLKKCRQREGITIVELAKCVGCSRPVMSRILSGQAECSPELIQRATNYIEQVEEKYPDLYEQKNTLLKKKSFFTTRDANNVIGVCSASQEYVGLGVIVGKSGYGKTHALKHFAQMPRVIYIECDDSMLVSDFLCALEEGAGLPSGRIGGVSGSQRLDNLKKFFNMNSGYLLIVDEADKLMSQGMNKKMEILRTLFDQSNVGIVIAGEPQLKTMLENHLDRFANRVDFFTKLEGLKPEEVREMLEDYNLDEAAMEELVLRGCSSKKGCFRLLDRTLSNIARLMRNRQGEAITLEVIREASSLMML